MQTRVSDVFRALVVVVVLCGAFATGSPFAWAALLAAISKFLR